MIVPDTEQLFPINHFDFLSRKYMLFENPSPVLPLHFDKSYLPSNHCLMKNKNVKSHIWSCMIACSSEIQTQKAVVPIK